MVVNDIFRILAEPYSVSWPNFWANMLIDHIEFMKCITPDKSGALIVLGDDIDAQMFDEYLEDYSTEKLEYLDIVKSSDLDRKDPVNIQYGLVFFLGVECDLQKILSPQRLLKDATVFCALKPTHKKQEIREKLENLPLKPYSWIDLLEYDIPRILCCEEKQRGPIFIAYTKEANKDWWKNTEIHKNGEDPRNTEEYVYEWVKLCKNKYHIRPEIQHETTSQGESITATIIHLPEQKIPIDQIIQELQKTAIKHNIKNQKLETKEDHGIIKTKIPYAIKITEK